MDNLTLARRLKTMNEGELHALKIVSELEKQNKLQLARRLKSIFFNDKTFYNYGGKDRLNRFEIPPEEGKRFLTPAEIALDMIQDLGYPSAYEVPDEGEQKE